LKSLDECISIGDGFWSSLHSDSKVFKEDDRSLLKAIFNPKLSDRHSEGDLFAPPDASHAYVARLRGLVKEEEAVRQRRTEEFFSQNFVMDEPSSLFPLSWKASFESSMRVEKRPQATLIARPDYKDKAAELLQTALQASAPVFDKCTEEGMRFRIYSLGKLEVRTLQEESKEEVVGAVFSTQPAAKAAGPHVDVDEHDRIIKATLYTERSAGSAKTSCPGALRQYYVIIETMKGSKIRMECSATGEATWEPEPADLEDRNSLAKVLLGTVCRMGMLVGDMKAFQAQLNRGTASPTARKQHAQKLFKRATGVASKRPYQGAAFCASSLMNSSANAQMTGFAAKMMENFPKH